MEPDKNRVIKLAFPEHRSILIEIHKAYDREYGFQRDVSEYQVLVDYLAQHIDIYHPFVLFADNKPAGYMRAYDRLSTSSCGLVLMLDLIYVLPEYRGKGLGREMMRYLVEFAAATGKSRIDLLTDLDNPAAVGLYEKFDFHGRNRFQMIRFIKTHADLQRYFEERKKISG